MPADDGQGGGGGGGGGNTSNLRCAALSSLVSIDRAHRNPPASSCHAEPIGGVETNPSCWWSAADRVTVAHGCSCLCCPRRADLLAFSVARQAALGQEEIFKTIKGVRAPTQQRASARAGGSRGCAAAPADSCSAGCQLRDGNEQLAERCKALAREVQITQAENKQLAGHISRCANHPTSHIHKCAPALALPAMARPVHRPATRAHIFRGFSARGCRVLGLVTSFTQAQASSNNEVRSVLTAQVLALTEHVSALTKQFTLFQFEQRQQTNNGPLPPRRSHARDVGSVSAAEADRRASLCSVYIATCNAIQCKPVGGVLAALTTGAEVLTLAVADISEVRAAGIGQAGGSSSRGEVGQQGGAAAAAPVPMAQRQLAARLTDGLVCRCGRWPKPWSMSSPPCPSPNLPRSAPPFCFARIVFQMRTAPPVQLQRTDRRVCPRRQRVVAAVTAGRRRSRTGCRRPVRWTRC